MIFFNSLTRYAAETSIKCPLKSKQSSQSLFGLVSFRLVEVQNMSHFSKPRRAPVGLCCCYYWPSENLFDCLFVVVMMILNKLQTTCFTRFSANCSLAAAAAAHYLLLLAIFCANCINSISKRLQLKAHQYQPEQKTTPSLQDPKKWMKKNYKQKQKQITFKLMSHTLKKTFQCIK